MPPSIGKPAAMLRRFLRDKRGATAVEYGLIVTCLSLVIIGGIQFFGNQMQARFTETANFLRDLPEQ